MCCHASSAKCCRNATRHAAAICDTCCACGPCFSEACAAPVTCVLGPLGSRSLIRRLVTGSTALCHALRWSKAGRVYGRLLTAAEGVYAVTRQTDHVDVVRLCQCETMRANSCRACSGNSPACSRMIVTVMNERRQHEGHECQSCIAACWWDAVKTMTHT